MHHFCLNSAIRFRIVACWLLISAIAFDASSQQFEETDKITSFHRNFGAHYGRDIAVWENYAVVGAFYDSCDANGMNKLHQAGAAYILEKGTDGNWKQVQKIVASDRHISQIFGWSVAIHGEYIIVGATRDTCITNINQTGAAYVFKRNDNGVWQEKQKLTASDRRCGNSQLFGWSVSIFKDIIVIGSGNSWDENNENYIAGSGAAYVFELNLNSIWKETQKLTANTRQQNAQFGFSVHIKNSDNILIAAPRDSTDANNKNPIFGAGAVYVFEKDGNGKFVQTLKLTTLDRNEKTYFGNNNIRLNENTLVISSNRDETDSISGNPIYQAGAAYVFIKDDSGNWKEVQKLTSHSRVFQGSFGNSVSMQGDYLAIGSPIEQTDQNGANPIPGAGAVYLYKKDSTHRFNFFRKLVLNDRKTLNGWGNAFGWSVSLTKEHLLVGAVSEFLDSLGNNSIQSAGAVYVFKHCEPTEEEISDTACVSYPLNGQTYTQSGTYQQVIKNTAGCDSTLTLHLQIIKPPPDTTLYYHVCANEKVVVGANEYTKPGTYTALFTSSNGCDSNVFVQITHKDAINPDIEVEIPVLYAYPLAADSYQWLDCRKNSEPIVGANEQTFEPPDNGEYAVSITIDECTEVSPCIKYSRQSEIYLPTAFSPNGDGVNDTYNPVYEGWLISKMSVFNRWGELVYESTDPNASWDGSFQGQLVPQGVYAILIVFQAMESKGSVQQFVQRNVSVQLLR